MQCTVYTVLQQQQGWSGNVSEEQWFFFSIPFFSLLLLSFFAFAMLCNVTVLFFILVPPPRSHKCSYQVRWQNKAKQIGIQWLTRVHHAATTTTTNILRQYSPSSRSPFSSFPLSRTNILRISVFVCVSFVNWNRCSPSSTIPNHLSISPCTATTRPYCKHTHTHNHTFALLLSATRASC